MSNAAAKLQAPYIVSVQGGERRWAWTLTDGAAVAARGEASTPVGARRSGEFAADVIGALERIGRRSF